jgi:hypothetical protein
MHVANPDAVALACYLASAYHRLKKAYAGNPKGRFWSAGNTIYFSHHHPIGMHRTCSVRDAGHPWFSASLAILFLQLYDPLKNTVPEKSLKAAIGAAAASAPCVPLSGPSASLGQRRNAFRSG